MAKRVKVFLASSSELVDDRQAFEILVNRKNKQWVDRGVFIDLMLWEDFLDVMSKTRLQDEYNVHIRSCDLFVLLFWTKVGRYTAEEFEAAVGQFRATDKPFILVYFKSQPAPGGVRDEDRQSLEAFEDRLEALGHYKTAYHNVDRLAAHFSEQHDKLSARGFITVPVAVQALRAASGDDAARAALERQAEDLAVAAAAPMPGRDRERGDTWGHEKRHLLAHAQALGWLLGDRERARALIDAAFRLADSGFAGYQAMVCMALAETAWVIGEGERLPTLDDALNEAQLAVHNVQDMTFCARLTARVNALRSYWWTPFALGPRARQLGDGVPRTEFAAMHRVGHLYEGRWSDALLWPAWAADDSSFDLLARRYQRLKDDFLRLNGDDRRLDPGEEMAVPDVGLVPHLAARLAAEMLAQAQGLALRAEQVAQLRMLVPHALPSATALDAVLARVVLAEGRRESAPCANDIQALEEHLARRPAADANEGASELIATRLPA